MATRTVWDRDLAGPDTETNWDGLTNTLWDLLPDILGIYSLVKWKAIRTIVQWRPIRTIVKWR